MVNNLLNAFTVFKAEKIQFSAFEELAEKALIYLKK